jgi:hypothetical protein
MNQGEFYKVSDINSKQVADFVSQHKFVYKYVPLERMLETLQKQQIVFVNPYKWHDPFDNFIFKRFMSEIDNTLLASLYCMCLTLNPHSEAYWKTYATENYTARFKLDTHSFFSFLKNNTGCFWLGKMSYIKESILIEEIKKLKGLKNSFKLDDPNDIFMKAFLMKRMPFQYEEEVRVLIKSAPTEDRLKRYNGTIKDIIKEIRLDPRMNRPEESALKDYIKKFEIKVTKSQLFTEKKIIIN